jgi:hypothetical protein
VPEWVFQLHALRGPVHSHQGRAVTWW